MTIDPAAMTTSAAITVRRVACFTMNLSFSIRDHDGPPLIAKRLVQEPQLHTTRRTPGPTGIMAGPAKRIECRQSSGGKDYVGVA